MATLKERIDEELKAALRARDEVRLAVLRMLKAAIRNAEIDQGGELDDAGVQKVVRKLIKQRRESVEAYRQAGREELAEREAAEIEVLKGYLPAELGDEELHQLVERVRAGLPTEARKNFGAVMGAAMREVAGRADGARVRRIVEELLRG